MPKNKPNILMVSLSEAMEEAKNSTSIVNEYKNDMQEVENRDEARRFCKSLDEIKKWVMSGNVDGIALEWRAGARHAKAIVMRGGTMQAVMLCLHDHAEEHGESDDDGE